MPESIVVAISTCPDETSARDIAAALVSERLATCVNRIGGVRSTYSWEGSLQDDAEILLVIKTTPARLAQLRARLATLHPYELPELLVLPVIDGNEAYLEWVRRGVAPANEDHPGGRGAPGPARTSGEASGGTPGEASSTGPGQGSSEDPNGDLDEDR